MKDYTEYKELYLKCFLEDTKEDAEYLFKTVLQDAFCIEKRDNGKLISMLFLMESNLITENKTIPVFYLYAAATLPERRGEGIMGELLKEAKAFAVKKGKKAIFLKPANKGLFKFYEKNGFSSFFKINFASLTKEELLTYKTNLLPKSLSLAVWQNKRKELLKNFSDCFADFSPSLFTAATIGTKAICVKDSAYAVYEIYEDKIIIKEGLFKENSSKLLLALAYFLLEKYNVNSVEVRTPLFFDNTGLFKEKNFSVIWSADDMADIKQKSAKAYHGFAFD